MQKFAKSSVLFFLTISILVSSCSNSTQESDLLNDESDTLDLSSQDVDAKDTITSQNQTPDSLSKVLSDTISENTKRDSIELAKRSPYFGINNGKIVYDVAIEAEDMNFMMQAMLPKEATTWFKDNMTCMVMKGGGGMMDFRVLNNPDKGVFANMFAGMGQKMAILMDPETAFGAKNSKVRVTGKTKKIAGVECKEAVIKGDSGSVSKVYFTDEFGPSQGYGSLAKSGVKGMMMEYRVDMRGMKMVLRAKEIKQEEPDPSLFVIPDGYTIKKREELGNGS
jgi:hypothetical protein